MLAVDDKKTVDIWEQSVELVNGHYQTDIPFRSKDPNLPDNRVIAEKRLRSLTSRFRRDPKLHAKYKAGIQERLDKGYAERVPQQEIAVKPGHTWYLSTTALSMKTSRRSHELYLTVQQPLKESLSTKKSCKALTSQTTLRGSYCGLEKLRWQWWEISRGCSTKCGCLRRTGMPYGFFGGRMVRLEVRLGI